MEEMSELRHILFELSCIISLLKKKKNEDPDPGMGEEVSTLKLVS